MLGIFKRYINKRLELLKIELTEMTSRMISILIFIFIALIVAMMFLFLVSFAVGMLIGKWLDNFGIGILIVSLIYLIAFIIILQKHEKIRDFIMAKIIEYQLNAIKDEEEFDEE